VNVACWCETDHATHDVDALSLVVGEETSLPQAFAVSAERLAGWLADPRDADCWRDRAALPPCRLQQGPSQDYDGAADRAVVCDQAALVSRSMAANRSVADRR
jgi:hypothetical protein